MGLNIFNVFTFRLVAYMTICVLNFSKTMLLLLRKNSEIRQTAMLIA